MRFCRKCDTTTNLASQGNICRKCKAILDKKYAKKKLEQQQKKRETSATLYIPATIGLCGLDYDPEACPLRRKAAAKRAKAGKYAEYAQCLQCEAKECEPQPLPAGKSCRICGERELCNGRTICRTCLREQQKKYRRA